MFGKRNYSENYGASHPGDSMAYLWVIIALAIAGFACYRYSIGG